MQNDSRSALVRPEHPLPPLRPKHSNPCAKRLPLHSPTRKHSISRAKSLQLCPGQLHSTPGGVVCPKADGGAFAA